MDIVSLSQGNFFLFKANTQNDSKVKASLLLQVFFFSYFLLFFLFVFISIHLQ